METRAVAPSSQLLSKVTRARAIGGAKRLLAEGELWEPQRAIELLIA
jgi:hypothetical protein